MLRGELSIPTAKQTPLALHPCVQGRYKWYITGPREMHPKKRRWRRYFIKKREAEGMLTKLQAKLLNQVHEGVVLPDNVMRRVVRSHKFLEPYGYTVMDALDFFDEHITKVLNCQTIELLTERFLADYMQDGKSKGYIYDVRSVLTKLAAGFPTRKLPELTGAMLDTWIRGLNITLGTRNFYIRTLRLFFSYAMLHGYITQNPALLLRTHRLARGKIGILTVPQMEQMLAASDTEILPIILIGGFAGLRPSELKLVTWEDLHWTNNVICVPRTKTNRPRYVDIEDNLLQWLQPYAGKTGKIWTLPQTRYDELFQEARVKAGIAVWPHNALRHSFASYLWDRRKDIDHLMDQMGHLDPKVTINHYRELVMPGEGEKWNNIFPSEHILAVKPALAQSLNPGT